MTNVSIDLTLCQGYGLCIDPSGGLIDLSGDGQAELVAESLSAEDEPQLRAAASMCPVSAITVTSSNE